MAAVLPVSAAQAMDEASMPPPGLYYIGYLYHYRAEDFHLPGTRAKLPGENKARITSTLQRLMWISDWKLLGADYGMEAIVPWTHSKLDFGLYGIKDSVTGLSDSYISPLLLGWHGPRWDTSLGVGTWLNNGSTGSLASPGRGYKSWSVNGGGTWYLDEGKSSSISAMLRWERFEGNAQGYRKGDEAYLEWGAGKRWGLVQASVVGYSQWQLSGDQGPGAGRFHNARHAVGGQLSYIFWREKIMLRAAYYKEFHAQAGTGLEPQGSLLRLTFIKAF